MEPDHTLIDAVETGDVDTVAAWLDLNPDLLQNQEWVEKLASGAIDQGQVDVLRLLLRDGVEANCRLRGGTLLHLATSGNCPDCVNLLITSGADPSQRDAEGLPPLYYAALRSMDIETIRLLAQNTVPMDLNTAVALGDFGLIQQTLASDAGSVRNAPQPAKLLKDAIWLQNAPPLLVSSRSDHQDVARPSLDIIRQLIRSGVDPNQTLGNHLPPLFDALSASNFDPGVVELLLQNGADVTHRSCEGTSVLQYAQAIASPQAILLIEQAYRSRGINPRDSA